MEILQKLGTIAGIAGISLGIFVIIFRDVIRKSIFPNLSKAQGYKLIRLILILTWTIAIIGILGWLYAKKMDRDDKAVKSEIEQKYDPLILVKKDSLYIDSTKK